MTGTKDLTLIAVSSDIYLANFQAPDRVDLNISITSETQDIQEGDPLGFRINVTNSGLTPATTIRISVPEPQGLKATVYSPSSGNFAANSATWELERLEPGTSQSLTLSGIAGQSSPIIASPSVRHLDQLDIDRSNNQATFTVAPSLPPGSGLVVRNTANDGVGSLRNALEFANAHPNINGSPDLVVFEIPSGDPGCDPSGLCTIQLAYSLPPAREPILIDGLTQSGSQNISWPPQLKIVINGSNVRAGGVGLHLSAGQSTVRGLVIQGFKNSFNTIDLTSSGGAAILLEGPGGNRVTTCFLGTDASGLTGNSSIQNEYGIQILNSGANTIGGNQPTTRNLISNNDEAGILIMGQSATANFILGNFIGSDASGTKPLPNEDGIYIEDAPANFIGGPDRSPGILNGSGNLISGNDGAGIYIEGDNAPGQVIQGNFIGVDVSGMVALPNDDPGIDVDDGSGNHTIGGASAPGLSTLASNVISGNDSHAIAIEDSEAHQNTIQGNYIGVALDGITPIPNRGNGIALSGDGNRIGGPEPQHRNLIASNAGSGIDFFASNDNVVQGNWIGVGNDGVTPLGNRDDGIDMTGAGNRIGGQNPNEGNIIAFNGRNGIAKYGLIGGSNENNQFTGNVIHHNTRLGIELNGDGVNPNVAAGSIDADPVAVALNYPVLNSLPLLTTEGSTTVSGVLQSIPLTLFRIEFFANESCDDSKFGEGQIYMGHLDVFTDVLGRVEFSTTLTNRPGIGAGWKVTATSTGPAGTSEFCQCDGFPSGAMVTNTSDSGPGSLREALSFARINPGPDTITFNIPTSDTGYDPAEGVWTISPQSPMPILNHPVVIDGLSQPGAEASNWPPVLKVEINGSAAGNFGGLNIGSSGVGIRGLILNRFMGAAISTAGNAANAAFIESNFIGTDAAGLSPRPNQQGVSLGGSGHRIGGNTAASGNLISGNLNAGVRIGGPDMSILNNLIGTTISGSQALGNEGPGVWLSSQGAIVTGNTISANGITGNIGSIKPNDGIFIQGNLNTVQGNKIGTDSSGNSPLANRGSGIEIFGGQQNLIGGASLTAANLIAHNGNDGVELNANISTMPRNNRITRNIFLMNGNLAIDLFGNGSTPNDTNDSDDGPNNLQNFPAIRLAQYDSSSGILSLTYQIDSHPNSSSHPLTTEFFVADPRKLEGQTFLGMDTFNVSDFQNVEPRRVLMSIPDGILHTGDSIVATATDNNGNTSEFSPAMIVTEFIAPPQLSVTFDPTTRTLTLIWPNRNGSTVQLESTETLSPPNWIPVTQGILAIENQFFYPIQFDSRNQSRFFRLR
ncbi:MAG: DUF11 domain-containing protein [Verrucomicrobia bacterium]|nr:DUF11 domain-containing protein [Verrucomicrobiota bacterium]